MRRDSLNCSISISDHSLKCLLNMIQSDPNRWVWWYKPTETPQKGLYGALVPARVDNEDTRVHGIFAFFRSFNRIMFMDKGVMGCGENANGEVRFAPGEVIDCPRCLAVEPPIIIDRNAASVDRLDPQPPVLG